jgi:hypothetical protein
MKMINTVALPKPAVAAAGWGWTAVGLSPFDGTDTAVADTGDVAS